MAALFCGAIVAMSRSEAWPRRESLLGAARALAAMVALSACVVAGCGSGGSSGNAFEKGYPVQSGNRAIRPGFELGVLELYLHNNSHATVVLDSIGVSGPGIGAVVRPVQVEVAPLRYGYHRLERDSVPSSLYQVTPPVFYERSRCRKQLLVPVRGFRMTPGSQAWVWIVLRAVRPGRWAIPYHVVNYSADGVQYSERIPLTEYGAVDKRAAYIPPYWGFAKCVGPATGATFLPGYHSGAVS